MADLSDLGFDANTVEPLAPREVLPEGRYNAVILATEMKANKANSGFYLEVTFAVQDGAHAGRTLKSRLNLSNPSAQAVQIGRAELSAICRAVGVLRPRDSAELHGLPLTLLVKVCKRKDNGEPTNEISGYFARQAQPAPATAPGTGTSPPWKRP